MVRLVSKGLVEQTIDRPKRYRPVDVKHSIPELASRLRDQFTEIAKESEQLAGRLESLAAGTRKIRREEVRIIYGANPARAQLSESIKSAEAEFWAIAGRERPPYISDRLLAETLQTAKSRGLKARIVLEIDEENLKRVERMTAFLKIHHYEPISIFAYGIDDKSVVVSLAQEPVGRMSQTAQLATTYRPIVQIVRQLFELLWRESTPFELRKPILLGQRPADGISTIARGRKESRVISATTIQSAKNSISAYIPTQYGPVRLLKALSEAFLVAHNRGARIRVICTFSRDNAKAIRALPKYLEVRHTDEPIGFTMGIVDDTDAAIHYIDPDSPELDSRTDFTIHISSKQGIRHLGNLFEALWKEAIPMEELLHRKENHQSEPLDST
jgi:sugar-specific transcriptional regulator TrmB